MRLAKLAAASCCMNLLLAGCSDRQGSDQADAGSSADAGPGSVVGSFDGLELNTAFAGVSNYWRQEGPGAPWDRFGEIVMLSNVAELCAEDPPDDPQRWFLAFLLHDTAPGTYSVVEDATNQYGSPVVEARLELDIDGAEFIHAQAVSGEVIVESIVPADGPLTADSIAKGSYELTFLENTSLLIECDGGCGPSGCSGECTCQRQDGSLFQCSLDGDQNQSCCNDGLTETQTITGSFAAPFCYYLCTCIKGDPSCPCFDAPE